MSVKSFFKNLKNLFSPSEYDKSVQEEMEEIAKHYPELEEKKEKVLSTYLPEEETNEMLKNLQEGRNQDRVQEALNAAGDTSDGYEEALEKFVEQEIREHREEKSFREILANKKLRRAYKTECINKHSSHHIFKLWRDLTGELVIYERAVYKFIGIGTDEHDFFYVLMSTNSILHLGSPVLDLIPLYELSDEHYKSLDFKLTKKRLKELTKEIEKFNILLDDLYAE